MTELILTDIVKVNKDFGVSVLRYFNPVDSHKRGLLEENPNGVPNNLILFVSKVAKDELKQLNIFGNDYNPFDGTGERLYSCS